MIENVASQIEEVLTIFFETTHIPIKFIDNSGNLFKSCDSVQIFCNFFLATIKKKVSALKHILKLANKQVI